MKGLVLSFFFSFLFIINLLNIITTEFSSDHVLYIVKCTCFNYCNLLFLSFLSHPPIFQNECGTQFGLLPINQPALFLFFTLLIIFLSLPLLVITRRKQKFSITCNPHAFKYSKYLNS